MGNAILFSDNLKQNISIGTDSDTFDVSEDSDILSD